MVINGLSRHRSGRLGHPVLVQKTLHTSPRWCGFEDSLHGTIHWFIKISYIYVSLYKHIYGVYILSIHTYMDTHKPYRLPWWVRTKRFLSDRHWQPTVFLYLPASVVRDAQGTIPAGGSWNSGTWLVLKPNSCFLPVFTEPDFHMDSKENKSMRKYTALMRHTLRQQNAA